MFSKLFSRKKVDKKKTSSKPHTSSTGSSKDRDAKSMRKGEIGEYKISIQLDQMPKEYKHLNDLLIKNPKSKSGYSQIDHVLITEYGIFVIETKNYQGTVYGGKDRKTWSVNGKFKMLNPFIQNYGHLQALTRIIGKDYEHCMISVVSFTKRCTFKIGTDLRDIKSNQLIVYDIELSEFINRKVHVQKLLHHQPLLSVEEVSRIYTDIKNQHIADSDALKHHVDVLKEQTKPGASCVVCNQEVSEKVKTFCLSNKKFNGKVYCYQHQK
ncbi:NERD domain-containing protein [Halobacillus sp. GSS1]|nr:NERD domain-containing protein [Halobacillus sp. GSS1]